MRWASSTACCPTAARKLFVRSYGAMIGENAPFSLTAAKGTIAEVTKAAATVEAALR